MPNFSFIYNDDIFLISRVRSDWLFVCFRFLWIQTAYSE